MASKEAIGNLKTSAAETASHLKTAAASMSSDAKDYASSVASGAADAFKDAVEANKTAGADAIANIAHSVKGAADGVEKQSPQIAGMVRSAAEGVERVSSDIRDRNVGELLIPSPSSRNASQPPFLALEYYRRRGPDAAAAKLRPILKKAHSDG